MKSRMASALAGAGLVLALASGALAADLPSDIEWTTNDDFPLIGSPDAKKGGTYQYFINGYPLTFRLMGPNSNDNFAGWNRAYSFEMTLVKMHPVTDEWIPWLATAWSIQPDGKTLYFQLDPDVRWSDGKKVTADDYVFAWEMFASPHIVDPFYNKYAEDKWESVEAIDETTLKIVGKYDSWRPLYEFTIFPMPRHAIKLDENYVKDYNNVYQTVVGPYTVDEAAPGQYVTFKRDPNWWGYGKRRFTGMYNPDRIRLWVITDLTRTIDYFKKRKLDHFVVLTARIWAEDMEFEAIKNGWAHRKRVFTDYPQGLYGMALNVTKPPFDSKDFRKAIQYLFNFDELNDKLMHNAYYRQVSAFTGTPYANPDLVPYPFDPRQAREHLKAAGFSKRGKDGILIDDQGRRAAFTFTYGSKGLERHYTVVQQTMKRFGVDMTLELLEPGTAFERGLERQFEASLFNRTTGFYPDPHQYYHSHFTKSTNNNNVWGFSNPKVDELIDVFRYADDPDERRAAMWEMDAILQDEAILVPHWQGPFVRFAYWDHIKFPETFVVKRFEQFLDWQIFWVDEAARTRLDEAIAQGKTFPEDTVIDVDPYGVKAQLDQQMAAADDGSTER